MKNTWASHFLVAVACFLPSVLVCHCQETAWAQVTNGGKKAAPPSIPGLPELPPGVELPPEVQSQLKKALQELKTLEDTAKTKQTPQVKLAPAAVPLAPNTKPKNPTSAPVPPSATRVATPSASAATTFKRVAKEKSLAKVGELDFTKRDNKKPHFWVSPDGRRLAYLIDKGIAVDDKQYQYQNSIRQADQFVKNFRFSPDSQRTSWIVHLGQTQGEGQGETLVINGVPEKIGWNFIANHDGGIFSRDSKHVAYTARRYAKGDVEYVLVVDGKEVEVFLKSPAWALTFTADSRRVIWAEDTGDHYEMRESSIDGSQPRIERKFGPAQLSMNFFYGPAGEVGYVASQSQGNKFIVYDGKELKPGFKSIKTLQLSRDGKNIAFVMEPENFREVVVVDGKSSPAYGGLEADYVKDSLALSPVGGRVAYGIENRRIEYPVIDGKQGKGYARVAEFTFSPDGKRVAHWAVQNGKLLVVADGRESAPYDELGLPVFSPDSKSLAHGAGVGQRKFVVINGQPQKSYAFVGEPEFSPDGKRLVYLADHSAEGPTILVDSGKEGKQYDVIQEQLYFSPTGQRLAMVTSARDHEMVVVDGVEGNRYDHIITLGGGKVVFDDEVHWHYLAVKDGEVMLVEETLAE
ncbi:WD40-like Beta Propeller Repeat protein [Anatilimnocola aggregata]|uniref:WD40-like Beta Propeller Repeat protein n=1 Tax=Anatilimnocola aggregata TaxID=2528021 RepID=A0A517YE04_9BACT|nr:PD40 domain-containing protein [Anatilimnocola aggregata]QDU28372.1 WD40-like Beta Propeller Repeat protein [Anatilimnocola aggregata]